VLSGRGLCDELITRPEESYRLCCVVVCDLETSRMGGPYIYIYIYDVSRLRVKESPFYVTWCGVIKQSFVLRITKKVRGCFRGCDQCQMVCG